MRVFCFQFSVFSGLLALLLFTGSAPAQITNTVTVAWDPNPESDEPTFVYRIYHGTVGSGLTNVIAVGNAKSGTVTNLAWATQHWFYVTAANSWGLESDPSLVLTHTLPPEPVRPSAPAAVTIELRLLSATTVLGPFTNEVARLEYRHALPLQLFVAEVAGITSSNTATEPPAPGSSPAGARAVPLPPSPIPNPEH